MVTIIIHITMQVCKRMRVIFSRGLTIWSVFHGSSGKSFSFEAAMILDVWNINPCDLLFDGWIVGSPLMPWAATIWPSSDILSLTAHSAFFLIDYIMLFLLRQCQTIQTCKILEARKDSQLVDCLIPKTYEYNKRTNHEEDKRSFWKRCALYIP